MMSSPKPAADVQVEVKISKETGGAYADVRQVIESELAQIKRERANRDAHRGAERRIQADRNGNTLK
jgi:hypothetical protein